MDRHVLYIRVEEYLRQWLLHRYDGEPICFPKWSKENDFLQENLRPRPDVDWTPEPIEKGIAIKVPKIEGFNRDKWCYVAQSNLNILKKMLHKRFLHDFFNFLCIPNKSTPTFKLRILDFMNKNGIEDNKTNMETLMQIRVRKRHLFESPPDIDSKANKAHKGCCYGRRKPPKKRK